MLPHLASAFSINNSYLFIRYRPREKLASLACKNGDAQEYFAVFPLDNPLSSYLDLQLLFLGTYSRMQRDFRRASGSCGENRAEYLRRCATKREKREGNARTKFLRCETRGWEDSVRQVDWGKGRGERRIIGRWQRQKTEGSQRKVGLIFRSSSWLLFLRRNKIDLHLVRESLTTLALPLPMDGILHFLHGFFSDHRSFRRDRYKFPDLYLYRRIGKCYNKGNKF